MMSTLAVEKSCLKADLHGTILSHATSLRHEKSCRIFKTLRQSGPKKCRKRVVRRLHATKSYHVNRP